MPAEIADRTPQPRAARRDVVVIGAGFVGSLAAALLAAEGAEVSVVDADPAGARPAGPSTSELTGLLRAVGRRHGVPEVEALASAAAYAAAAGRGTAAQRGIGFIYHGAGRQHPRQTNTFVPPRILDAPPYFDAAGAAALLLDVARRNGATVVTDVAVDAIDPSAPHVRLSDGRQLTPHIVVDTLVARPDPSVAAESIAIADLALVRPYDATPAAALHDAPVPWRATTLHHIVDDSMVVTGPAPEDANAALPVTLRWTSGSAPDEQFATLLRERPDLAAAFGSAKEVAPWRVLAPYGAPLTGVCYVELPEPRGATDAFDRTLPTAVLAASTLAALIAEGRDTGPVTELVEAGRAHDARWRAALRIAARDYATWNAAFRVWAVGQVHGTVWAEDIRRRAAWDELTSGPYPGSPLPESADYARLTEHLYGVLDEVVTGARSPATAADEVFADLATAPVVPPTFGLADPQHRHYVPSPPRMLRAMRWARTPAAEAAVAARIAPTVRSLLRERIAARRARMRSAR
jgi:FADH2 O2-dependent halogenase